MITVQVFYESNGKPASSQKVSLFFSGLFTGGSSDTKYTDNNGEAHFSNDPGDGEVYVNSKVKHKGRLAVRIVVYI